MTPDPLVALLVFFGLVGLSVGAWKVYHSDWFINTVRANEKTQIEDILKLLFHVESSKQRASLNTLGGALNISDSKLLHLVEKMTALKLIRLNQNNLELTEEGREYALQIIRVHRLWEKHLSEKTGLDPREWHPLAEQKEHSLTPEQTNQLSQSLGHPRFDPHGDPIPTEGGEMVALRSKPLSALAKGALARIVHIEDEPKALYEQILKRKLHIGSKLKLIGSDENEIVFRSEGNQYALSPIVASNIHVSELSNLELLEENAVRLSSLRPGEKAKIVGISSECRGANRRRLLDLGFVMGSIIEAEFESPMKQPKAYSIRNTIIALRDSQSELILIEKEK